MTFWREPPLAEMNFDVAVDSERPFIVKNNLVDGAMRPQLTLVGTGEVPVLNGTIFVDPTRVSLPSGTLHVDSGLIQFRQNDPFVPQLELSAKTRLWGYDIRAYVTGPYDEPEIELSSIPPLPQEDLLVLFLTGTLPSATDGNASREAATTVALYFAKDLLSNWLSSDSEDEGLLDRVEFVVGADVSRTGAQTWSVKYFINEAEKGTGFAHYALAERDVYDKVNYGYGFRFRFR
jgi:translocation and assembly module TamB